MSLSPAPTLAERVTERLRTDILGGAYEIGESLPSEQEFGLAFGVSRSVVREAISRLKADGLVSARQGRGAYVLSTTRTQGFQIGEQTAGDAEGTRHILQLRMGIEVEASGLAAANRNNADLAALAEALNEMRIAGNSREIPRLVLADLRFHRLVCVASTNPHFLSFFDFLEPYLQDAISKTRHRSAKTPTRLDDAQREHEMIFFAINTSNPEAARAAARLHVLNTLDRVASDQKQSVE